jgi:hypothetical protein
VPCLEHALAVMAAWGFTYRSGFVWIKERNGTGYWARNRHEHLLIGAREPKTVQPRILPPWALWPPGRNPDSHADRERQQEGSEFHVRFGIAEQKACSFGLHARL